MTSYAKQPRYESERYRRAVASLECVHCGRPGVQVAHRNRGKGMGIKTDDCLTAALCPEAHSMIDQGSTLTREERRTLIDHWILLTVAQMFRRGFVDVVKVV